MSELAERARQAGKLAYWKAFEYAERPDNGVLEIADLIEQALLAERRLAMEEAITIANGEQLGEELGEGDESYNVAIYHVTKALRAAAEKEIHANEKL